MVRWTRTSIPRDEAGDRIETRSHHPAIFKEKQVVVFATAAAAVAAAVRGSKIAALVSVFALRLDMLGLGMRNKKEAGTRRPARVCVWFSLAEQTNFRATNKVISKGAAQEKKRIV